MGLDSVELLVTIENAFDIEFTDDEAKQIITVGDFYEAVWAKLGNKENDRCKTAMLFYKFRNFFENKYNISRHDFNPDITLESIIPEHDRKVVWQSIHRQFGFKLPELILPHKFSNFLFWFGAITILGGIIFAWLAVKTFHTSVYWWLFPIIGLILTVVLSRGLQPYKTSISVKNVREFIETTLALNYDQLRDNSTTSRQEMQQVMRFIIHDRSGVDLSEIVPEALIVKDLGID